MSEERTFKAEIEFLDELDPKLMYELGQKNSAWIPMFKQFIQSDAKNCVLTFKNAKDKKNCLSSLRAWKNKYNLNVVYGNYSPGLRIYIVKCKQL